MPRGRYVASVIWWLLDLFPVVLSERADPTRILPTEEVTDNRQGNVNTLYNAVPVHGTPVNAIHQRQMFLGIPVIGSHVPDFWRETAPPPAKVFWLFIKGNANRG